MMAIHFAKNLMVILGLSLVFPLVGLAGPNEDLAEINLATQKLYQRFYQNLDQSKIIYHFASGDGPKDVKLSYVYEQDFVASLQDALLAREAAFFPQDAEQEKYEAEFNRDLPRKAQAAAHALAVAQEAQQRLAKVLGQAQNDANQPSIAYLQALLFPLTAENLKFDLVGLGAGMDFNAQSISLSYQLGRDLPEATLLMVLAHELGHALSLPNFLGYFYPVITAKKSAYHFAKAQSAMIAQKARAAQGHQVKDYPFLAALKEYRKLGVSGLDYLDLHKRADYERVVQQLYAQVKDNDDLILLDDDGPEITVIDEARLIPALTIANAIVNDETGLAEKLTNGQTEKYISRMDEVLADHFAKLVLEDKAAEINDPAARRQFVEEALLLFFTTIEVDEALKWYPQYPALLLPELQSWWKKSLNPSRAAENIFAQIWQDNWRDYFLFDDHPRTEERLKIFLSSPILRQAILADI